MNGTSFRRRVIIEEIHSSSMVTDYEKSQETDKAKTGLSLITEVLKMS